MRIRPGFYCVLAVSALVSSSALQAQRNSCGRFPDWASSPSVLPYPAGSSYYVSQANCSSGGHQGPYKYSYDFVMPIGTKVTAARAGVVAETRTRFRDGQSGEGQSNWVKIRHEDGTIAAYSHLTEQGVLVKVGDQIVPGQLIGLSGNTGNTGGLPHLHFHVCPCSEPVDCGTLPVTFRNTDPNPDGLQSRRKYVALQ